jgi:very-short-patch-repair endonuclease
MLQWRDQKEGELAHSPVVLVPVELIHEAPGKPYQLSMYEDDIVVNPTLKEALRQYYALELEDLPEDLDKDGLKNYLASIDTIAANQKDWNLDPQVVLDVFSYQKQIIVTDLKQNTPALKSHPLIMSMSIAGFPLPQNDLHLFTAQELDDKVAPQQMFQILDADSSQQEAIEAAKAGLSFVLQGPPGTGKSQTIANIITEFLASGRHVLFVSAKMAALEVVQDRLKKAGLGDFCLQVHSHKRNKHEVVDELGQSLEIEPEAAPASVNTKLDLLQKTRTTLNYYVRTLHAPQFSLGISAFQAYCELVKFREAPDIKCSILNLSAITPQKFESQKDIVEQLSVYSPVIQNYPGHPWYGVRLDELSGDKQTEIENNFIEFKSNLEGLKWETNRLAEVYGIYSPENYAQSSELYRLACDYIPDVMKIPAADIQNRYEHNYQSFLRYLKPQYWKDSSLLGRVSRTQSRPDLKKAVEDLARIIKIQERILPPALQGAAINKANIAADLEKTQGLISKLKTGLSFIDSLYLPDHKPEVLATISTQNYDVACAWLQNCLDQINRLREWVNFTHLSRQAAGYGIENFVDEAIKAHLSADQWPHTFLKRFYLLWIDAIGNKEAVFSNFNSQIFESNIDKFKVLDREQIRLSKFRIREGLLQHRPKVAWMNVASSEEAILRREMNKKRRIKPLRRLFSEIPGLILRLRPCLMMSPLTVSQLLDPELFKFDLVIFDEASQIHPEEAVGAIIRGSQTIIVGDKHQLPPTSFFEVLDADEDNDDENGGDDLESILNEGEAAGLSNKMLEWHYRSKDESLIAFSNHNFYSDRLLTFPNARQDDMRTGVSFLYLPNGVYQRSGHHNLVEADKVVDLIIDHYKTDPGLSLGVVTFSQAQKDTIQWELDQRLRINPDLQVYFSDAVPEPAFVKNLELVQGDERDVIIFSIGYGRDETNKFYLRFGPLNNEGGERRLNVAVTRARYKVILVSSIQPEDIDISKTNSRGVKLLRSYMTLARDGIKAIYADLKVNDDTDCESPFEASVYDALARRGLSLKKQVGVSDYRIDLAVFDPNQPGHFLLGIECDGAMYRSGATARDRDRLRQEVLEGLGWCIHRIWSRDWFNDPEHEVQKVLQALDRAVAKPDTIKTTPVPVGKKTAELKREDPDIKAKKISQPASNLPDGAIHYQEVVIPKLGYGIDNFYLRSRREIIDLIEKIVRVEGPIEIDILNARVGKAWNIQRIGPKMKSTILQATIDGSSRGQFEKRGNFIWPKGLKTPTVRAQSESGVGRDIDQVCDEEIAEAVFAILKEAISLDLKDLIKLTAQLFGSRANERVTYKVNCAIDMLIKAKRIEWRSEKLRIPRE